MTRKPARSELREFHKAITEESPDRNCSENKSECKRPVAGQEAPEQFVDEEREQQDERQITKIALAKENVLDRTEISEARPTIAENAFTALEEAREVTV